MPWFATTPLRRWLSLLGISIAMCFASGPIAAWPTLEPLIIERGVFSSDGPQVQADLLGECYSVALFGQLVTYFVGGLFFDRLGPMGIGIIGALLAAAGLVLFAIALLVPGADALIFIGYPMATTGGAATTNAICTYNVSATAPAKRRSHPSL